MGYFLNRHRFWVIGIAAGLCATVFAAQEFISAYAHEGLPLFQRRQADREACLAAVAGVAQLRLAPSVTSSDCTNPKVTPKLHQPGTLIVTLRPAASTGKGATGSSYSVLVDGRGTATWRVLEIQMTPDRLVLEVLADVLDPRPSISMTPSPSTQSATR